MIEGENIKYTELSDTASTVSAAVSDDTGDKLSKITFIDRIIDGMNTVELAVTNFAPIKAIRNRIDEHRMGLQTDVTGGAGKLQADLDATTNKLKDIHEKIGAIAAQAANTAMANANKTRLQRFGEGVKSFAKSGLGLAEQFVVQGANIPIKAGAVLFNTAKLGVIGAGMLGGGGALANKEAFYQTAKDLGRDVKGMIVAAKVSFAAATAVLSLGVAPAAGHLIIGGIHAASAAVGKAFGLTATQFEVAGATKKGLFSAAELAKGSGATMAARDPEMYEKLVKLRAEHIDKPETSIEERKAAAVVEKEILETFRNNQNTVVGMPVRIAKKIYAKATGKDVEETATQAWGRKVEVKKDSLSNSAFHTATFGAFKSFESRQAEGHAKIDEHIEHLKHSLENSKAIDYKTGGEDAAIARAAALRKKRDFDKSFSRQER